MEDYKKIYLDNKNYMAMVNEAIKLFNRTKFDFTFRSIEVLRIDGPKDNINKIYLEVKGISPKLEMFVGRIMVLKESKKKYSFLVN